MTWLLAAKHVTVLFRFGHSWFGITGWGGFWLVILMMSLSSRR